MKIKRLSKNLVETLKRSVDLARENNCIVVDENVLLASLLMQKDSAAVRILQEFEIDIEQTVTNIISSFTASGAAISSLVNIKDPKSKNNLLVSTNYKKILEDAYKVALNMTAPYVGTEHLLVSWYEDIENEIKSSLVNKGIDHNVLFQAIKNTVKYPVFLDDKQSTDKNSILRVIGRNLTELARNKMLDPVVGREKEMDRVASILMRRTKNNPILVGDAGVGKTAIVEGFVQKIVNGTAPYLFHNKSIWQIDTAVLYAGSPMRGDVENKLLALIDEVSADPSIILFVDEIHTIMGGAQPSGGSSDIANILKPALAKGQLRCIGATTYNEYVKYIESDPAVARRFQPVTVEEIDPESSKVIISNIKPTLEKYHHVSIPEPIVEEAIELAERYILERYLPDKAIDLLDEAAASVNLKHTSVLDENAHVLENLEQEQQRLIEENDIDSAAKIRQAKREIQKIVRGITSPKRAHTVLKSAHLKNVVSQWTNIPVDSLTTADVKKIRNLSRILSSAIVGQSKAVNIVADALQVAKVGISDEKRPMASFLFAGPTGVGKTELAKQIAISLFGSKDNLIQLDMSEYMEAHSVSKLIGSPPGYVGFDAGGQLTEKIRKQPYNVILFDEIEKSHPDVLNILLQILEEGKLTDSKGRVANFKNTIVVMTTNLGAEAIINNESLGLKVVDNSENSEKKAYEEIEKSVLEELKEYLAPEFINRIDHVVVFKSLTNSDIELVAKIQLDELCKRLKKYKKIDVTYSSKVTKLVAKLGFDEEYGARNIKRKINELVESTLSKFLLSTRGTVKKIDLDVVKDTVVAK